MQDRIAVLIKPPVPSLWVVGSPGYLKSLAIPANPAELRDHAYVR